MAVKGTTRPSRSAPAARSRAPRKTAAAKAARKTAVARKAARTTAAARTKVIKAKPAAGRVAKTKTAKAKTAHKAAKTKVAKAKVAKVAKAKTSAKRAVVKAAVAARRETVDRTTRHEGVATLKVDPTDEAAIAIIARKKPATRPTRARRSAVDRLTDPPPATGTVLIERVSRAIERELTQIETIIGGHHVNPAQRSESERRARTLASLARTLREVMALRANDRKEKSEDDDAVPRDINALRLALARRLDSLVAGAKAAHPEGAE